METTAIKAEMEKSTPTKANFSLNTLDLYSSFINNQLKKKSNARKNLESTTVLGNTTEADIEKKSENASNESNICNISITPTVRKPNPKSK